MTKSVGSVTFGISLVIIGGLFVAKAFNPHIDWEIILNIWPVVMILLGVEILVNTARRKGEKLFFDAVSIILTVVVCLFSMLMGTSQVMLETYCIL